MTTRMRLVRAEHPENVGREVAILREEQPGCFVVSPAGLVGVNPTHPVYAYAGDLEPA